MLTGAMFLLFSVSNVFFYTTVPKIDTHQATKPLFKIDFVPWTLIQVFVVVKLVLNYVTVLSGLGEILMVTMKSIIRKVLML